METLLHGKIGNVRKANTEDAGKTREMAKTYHSGQKRRKRTRKMPSREPRSWR